MAGGLSPGESQRPVSAAIRAGRAVSPKPSLPAGWIRRNTRRRLSDYPSPYPLTKATSPIQQAMQEDGLPSPPECPSPCSSGLAPPSGDLPLLEDEIEKVK